jgi:NAD(P)H dehydrogenase (quinone)
MPHILILNGNPKSSSFAQAICAAYTAAMPPGWSSTQLNLADMQFNPDLHAGYDDEQSLEPHLLQFQQHLQRADYLLVVAPVWWGGIPAKLKGLFDRSFLSGFAYRFNANSIYPEQLLSGKRAGFILTMDAPGEMLHEQAAPVLAQLGEFTLGFSGIKQAEPLLIGSIQASSVEQRERWLQEVREWAAIQHKVAALA